MDNHATTNNEQTKLEPCPWCRKVPKITKIEGSLTNPELVACESERCPMALAMTPEDWNTRVSADSTAPAAAFPAAPAIAELLKEVEPGNANYDAVDLAERVRRVCNRLRNAEGAAPQEDASHSHCWHERTDAPSYCCRCENLPHATPSAVLVDREAAARVAAEAWTDVTHLGLAGEVNYPYVCEIAAKKIRALPAAAETVGERDAACPCLHAEPCDKHCTCVNQHSSHGCAFCCSYGSEEQQRVRAKDLRRLILLGIAADKGDR